MCHFWKRVPGKVPLALLAAICLAIFVPEAMGQEPAMPAPGDSLAVAADISYGTNIAGEFTPAKGFDVIKTEWGSLNISMYGLFRYLNQTPAKQTFTDHLGREKDVRARHDIN